MSLRMKQIFASLILGLLLVFSVAGNAYAYSDILAFGDSLSDNGNADGYGNGIYTNGNTAYPSGAVWVDYLAENLGVSLLDMAYGGAISGQNVPVAWRNIYDAYIDGGADDSTAAYFANASGYDSAYGLQWQVNEYITTVRGEANISNTLITMTAGGNDYFNFLRGLAGDPYSPQSATDYAAGLFSPDIVVGNISTAIQALIDEGGENFLIMNLAIEDSYGGWADAYNAYLAAAIQELNEENDGVSVTLLDMLAFVPVATVFDVPWLDEDAGYDPDNPQVYAWWDTVGVHPTTEIHAQIAEYAQQTVPVPGSMLLMVSGLLAVTGIRRRKAA